MRLYAVWLACCSPLVEFKLKSYRKLCVSATPHGSILILASLITFAYFATSDLISAPTCVGVSVTITRMRRGQWNPDAAADA